MPLLPGDNINRIGKVCHGGLNYTELENLGMVPSEVIDFSSNLNPFIPLIEIRDIEDRIAINRYPDPESVALRQMIAAKLGLSIENIIAGNGSTELIRLAATAYLGTGDRAFIIEPTYGEYRIACEIAGARIVSQTLSEENGFEPDTGTTVNLIKENSPKVIFLCNPNNPTGYYLDRERFKQILKAAPDSLIVLDEAYISFVEQAWPSIGLIDEGNLLIIRSMTKDYSLAGMRLGYAVANREIIEVLNRICPPWNVNTVAQQAGIVALQNEDALQDSLEDVRAGKRYLIEEIERLGFCCLPSETNFFLVKAGDAAGLKKKLLEKSILVRDCASFGLPSYMRIAVGTMENNRKLVASLKEIAEEH
jgi:histidinol-phosphate aminotransferase